MTVERIIRMKEACQADWMKKPNVIGVGVGLQQVRGKLTNRVCLTVLVSRKLPAVLLKPEDLIPTEVEDVETDVVETGPLDAYAERSDRLRPMWPGASLGHYQAWGGTFGAVVRDRTYGTRLMLSTNHALACANQAKLGDAVVQPAAIDGGHEKYDTVAYLVRSVPIRFHVDRPESGLTVKTANVVNKAAKLLRSKGRMLVTRIDPEAVNLVDAAIARPADDTTLTEEILEIGAVHEFTPPRLEMKVRKSGRSTGLTNGLVIVTNALVEVQYEGGRTARFEDQILTTPMAKPGDSGALLVTGDDDPEAVGLLFAGSDRMTVYNPIQAVLDGLDVDL